MAKRSKLNPSWHRARVAARIWLKARQGRSLSPRDRRLAGIMAKDPMVTNELIELGIEYWQAPFTLDAQGQVVARHRRVQLSDVDTQPVTLTSRRYAPTLQQFRHWWANRGATWQNLTPDELLWLGVAVG